MTWGDSIMVRVEQLAGSALLQDRGRVSLVASGVPRSGPMDPVAHATALRLVASEVHAATIEVVGRLRLRPVGDALVLAATGAVAIAIEGISAAPSWTAIQCPAGTAVQVHTHRGFGYLAIAGLRADRVLGSAATCVLGGIGPAPLAVGQHLAVREPGPAVRAVVGSFAHPPAPTGPLGVVVGPHVGLPGSRFRVSRIDRIGVRLEPLGAGSPGPGRVATLPSLGVLPGTIQALPNGALVILGPDAGTMGGYPVAGVLAQRDLWRLGNLEVGDELRLAPVPPDPQRLQPRPTVVRPLV